MSKKEVARVIVSVEIPSGQDPDILSINTYGSRDVLPDQMSFDDPPQHAPQPSDTGRTASAVPLTPQTPSDQRTEISETSGRNSSLMTLDAHFSSYKSRKSELEQAALGGTKHKYSSGQIVSLEKNMNDDKQTAKEAFVKACGSCALDCQIRDQYPKWVRVHGQATGRAPAGQESRLAWRRRLLSDPEAPCLPPKQPSSKKSN